jgi:hypothetical protein
MQLLFRNDFAAAFTAAIAGSVFPGLVQL